jgi:hypothetical protein
MFSQPIVAGIPVSAGDTVAVLNAETVTPRQIEAALCVLEELPVAHRRDPVARANALQAYARDAAPGDEAVASAALQARTMALVRWTDSHDPERQSDAQAVLCAAARFPLADMEGDIAFEPTGFQEMILFIEELPW